MERFERGLAVEYWLGRAWDFISHRRTRYVAAWIGVLIAAGITHYYAMRNFKSRHSDPQQRRRDGSDGHCTIDFGGQWLMGRMLVQGHGRELYNRNRQYEVAWQAFPREREAPAAESHDAENLLSWFMEYDYPDDDKYRSRVYYSKQTRSACALALASQDPLQVSIALNALQNGEWTFHRSDDAASVDAAAPPLSPTRVGDVKLKHIGGPLYPPIHALLIAPLALIEPQPAYRITQLLMLSMAFVGGLGVSVFTERRIWWPVAAAMIMFFPGFRGSHHLGQNAALSLAILIWGWVLMTRNKETLGGALWGLLAFKPTIAAAFFLVPLLTRRWKACLAMIGVGVGLALATLPFVGVETWLDWLKNSKVANATYNVDENWIFLSRDILGIPRRFLVNFADSYYDRDRWYIAVAGWVLWLLVVETTLRVALLCREQVRTATGPAPAVVLLGAWASCFHFMYYDSLLSFLGIMVLLAEPKKFVQPILALFSSRERFATLSAAAAEYFKPRLPKTHPVWANQGQPLPRVLTVNSFLINAFVGLLIIQHLFPWISVTGTFIATNWFPAYEKTTKDGSETKAAVTADWEKTTERKVDEGTKTKSIIHADTKRAEHSPKLEITTNLVGPPWDTFALLVIWAWAGIMTLRKRE